jgi:hypothetical protein
MNAATRAEVHKVLKNFTKKNLKTYDVEVLKKQYPFHRLFFDDVGLVAFKQERTMVTNMGNELYPQLAKIIASEFYKDVVRDKHITGIISKKANDTMSSVVRQLREPKKQGEKKRKRTPNHEKELEEIRASAIGDTEKEEIGFIADIYIGDFPGGRFFAEIKSPLPNLDVCAETKYKILAFKIIFDGQNPCGYLAFAYNPFLTRDKYKHSFTKQIMDLEKEVLMGQEFWDLIGGKETYNTILEIIEEVAQEILTEIEKSVTSQTNLFEFLDSSSETTNDEATDATDEE